MSPERAFEIVTNGLASQRWEKSWAPSINSHLGMDCKLRSPDGKKCALGWLIPDEKYTPDMDTCSAEWPLPDITQSLLNDMRAAHDHSFSPRDMWSCFRRIAEKYNFPFTHPAPEVGW
jgi:hypothetical protein